jgi:hypothetical protein
MQSALKAIFAQGCCPSRITSLIGIGLQSELKAKSSLAP